MAGAFVVQSQMQISRRGLIAGAAAAFAARGAWAAPAEPPAELEVVADTHYAPDLAVWAGTLQALCRGWWPKIVDRLGSPGLPLPARVDIVFVHVEPRRVAAVTKDQKIYIDADHVRANPETGFVAHELVHVAQHYPDPHVMWLTEGIADYLRYYVLLPDDPLRRFGPGVTYAQGYQPAAAMLDWAVKRHGPSLIRRINAAMRAGRDGEAEFTAVTGQTPQAMWAQFAAERLARPAA